MFNTRLTQANLITKADFDFKLSDLNRKITTNKTKHLLVEIELNKLKTFHLSYFIGKSHFDGDGISTNNRYFKVNRVTNTDYVLSWKYKELPAESIKQPTTSDNSFTPELNQDKSKTRVKFNESCLQQSKISYIHSTTVNIYIAYELGASGSHNKEPTLKKCLLGAVTLTKNADIDKYKYCYGIEFERRSNFSFPNDGFGQNIFIFGVDMSSFAHVDNKKKDILVLGKEPTQGLENTSNA